MSKNLAGKVDKLKKKVLEPEKEVKKDSKNKLLAVISYLQKKYLFRYNVIAAKVEYKEIEKDKDFRFMDERALDSLLINIKVDGGLQVAQRDFEALIGSPVLSEDYNPFMNYISSLLPWDRETDHIELFLKQITLLNEDLRPHLNKCFKKWFVALVGSLITDGLRNDTCFVLVGEQGKRKTTLLNNLVPVHLRLHYLYNGNFQLNNKDHEEMLGNKILINLDELATLNRADIEFLKSRMTQSQINLRRAYGRGPIHLWRRASFCGSINRAQFLTDLTGNRRFLPFMIKDIVIDESFDVGLLYAEALQLYREGYQYYFSKDEIKELELYNEEFRDTPLEEEIVLRHFRRPKSSDTTIEYKSTGDIAMHLAKVYNKINVNQSYKSKLGQTLERLGFVRKSHRIDGMPIKAWEVVVSVSENGFGFDGIAKKEDEISYPEKEDAI